MNAPANPQAKRHLGQILIDQGILTEDQLRIALLEQTKQHVPVGRLLVQLGFVSEATLRDALSEKLGLQAVDLGRIIVDPSALKLVPRDMARRYGIFPVALDRQQKKFIVALADTNNIVALDQLRAHLKGDYEIARRIAASSAGGLVCCRVVSLMAAHGESLLLRILERQMGIVPLDKLNLEETQLELLKRMLARPEGIILVTGPTGSRKTTTLYSILNHINSDGINIMTLEDPVEYPMTVIRQTSVSEAAKLDFANGIRALMRQDPDAILVGEIRDHETAEMAFRAAMTGHQVYSTLHTNSAAGAFPRLLDIGIVPDILAGNIIGILGQRLVRKLCRTCRQSYDPDVRERRLLGIMPTEAAVVFRAVGCEQCDYQGYRGRQSILEILKIDAAIDELIARRATAREIVTAARAAGFRTLADAGVRLVRDGTTRLDEVMRVVDLRDRMGARQTKRLPVFTYKAMAALS